MVIDHDDADDLVQEVFVKVWKHIGNFREDAQLYTWIYRIAINTAKNHLVSMGRKSPAHSIDIQDAEDYGASDWLKEYASPEREALAGEIQENINQAVSHLPADLREAIMLREMEGLSYEDIATAMDCPIGTVRSRIFRAREAIDEKLEPLLDEYSHNVGAT